VHPELPLDQLIALCDGAVRLRWQQSGVLMGRHNRGKIHAKPVEGKTDRYEDSGWVRVGKLRDAIVRTHLVIWWNERTDELRCVEAAVWPRMAPARARA